MKIKKGLLIVCIGIPLLVGGLSALLTGNAMQMFERMIKPPLSPPALIFPVAWSILYTLMGTSLYLILTSGASEEKIRRSLILYGYQLAVNFLWSTFFFNLGWYFFSLLWLIFLWILVFLMIRAFAPLSKWAAGLNVPYLIWLTFAAYLNAGVWWLNR